MFRCKVSSGEFEIILVGHSLREAANEAIRLHDQQKEPTSLGDLTLVEEVDVDDSPTGDHLFLSTKMLIEKNTLEGYGTGDGQYSRFPTEKD